MRTNNLQRLRVPPCHRPPLPFPQLMNRNQGESPMTKTMPMTARWALGGLSLAMLMPSPDTSIANAARTTAAPALPNSPLANGTQPPVVRPIASGTSALVGSGAEIAASTLAVQANQLFNLQSYPGSLGLSAYASLGVGLAVVYIASSVTA